MVMDELFEAFLMEGRELLTAMEQSLLCLEVAHDDRDAIDALFRATHTLKGSGGMLGLEAIVTFSHQMENLLDLARDGKVLLDSDRLGLLLSCRDHLDLLVEQIATDASHRHDSATLMCGNLLIDRLKACQDGGKALSPGQSDYWHISLRFGSGVLRYGEDPLSIVHSLDKLGKIVHISTLPEALPLAQDSEAENCYLGFEIDFLCENIDKARIEQVFEFIGEECSMRILPPHSHMEEYIQLLEELPEDKIRLGDLLVSCGALTRKELDEALQLQAHCAEFREETGQVKDKPVCQLGDILVEQGLVPLKVVDAALMKQKTAKQNKALESTLIRVQSAKLNHLIDLAAQMVALNEASCLWAEQHAGLLASNSLLTKLACEIRDSAIRLGRVQIGETFNRFNRAVRDISREIGKDIVLSIKGAELELDKSLAEKMVEPLMHLIRNSMDHGIETADLRLLRGKPDKGLVQLNAYQDSDRIIIEVCDDGAGLNREKILAKALEKGLVEVEHRLSEQEIYQLIFSAGFSTAESVTHLSGRGVGLDVVRHDIEELRGTILIDSREGLGTCTRICLPLTLAIVEDFMI